MSTVIKDLGAVSAYAYAVEKGYTGTEAEFAELMASYAEVGQAATNAAESALNSKTAAQTAATTATNKASEATTAAQTATTKAGEASQSASDANTAKEEAVTAKTAAETAQGKAEDAQAAAESVAESIPSDYSQLSEDVSDLKEGLNTLSNLTTNQNINWINDFGVSTSLFKLSSGNLVSDMYKSGYRVASNYSTPIRLVSGSYLTIPSDRRVYVYYSADNAIGSWVDKSGAWITKKYIIPETGYYAFTFSSLPADSVSVTNVKTFLTGFTFFGPVTGASLAEKVESLNNIVYGNEDWKENVQYGTVIVDQSGWSNSTFKESSRICINVNAPISLAKGDVIKIPYGYALFVAYRKNGTYNSVNEWFVADYFCPDAAEYVFTMRTYDDSPFTQSTIAEITSLISIISVTNFDQYMASVASGTDFPIKTVARLGYNISSDATPPEQSIASYTEAYKRGYRYMLCDVRWTSDHVPVALHDATINSVARNSDGTVIATDIEISQITLSQADEYDFGIIKGSAYAGTKIMRIADFLRWCVLNKCHPILEIKTDGSDLSESNVESLIDVINMYNMGDDCIYVIDRQSVGEMVHTNYPNATIGVSFSDGSSVSTVFGYAAQLKNNNDVFIYVYAKESFTYLIFQTLVDAAAEYKVGLGLTECKNEAQLETFLDNDLDLSVKWLAIRDMPFYEYMRKRNIIS